MLCITSMSDTYWAKAVSFCPKTGAQQTGGNWLNIQVSPEKTSATRGCQRVNNPNL